MTACRSPVVCVGALAALSLSAQPFKDFAAYRDALVYQEPQTDAEIALIHEILLDDRRTSEEMSKRMAEHFKTKAEKKNA